MISTQTWSIRLFRLSGIQVYLHLTWFLAAWYFISANIGAYRSIWWNVAECLSLFLIVLMHEFGHAFAARQAGGESKEIILWPFGGIAFAKVPPRPGAELWAVAAGPLVNVMLIPILAGLWWLNGGSNAPRVLVRWDFFRAVAPVYSTEFRFFGMIYYINLGLIFFNLMPIYPLDGGQILRSLLWFGLGRARSLQVAAIIGFVGIGWLLFDALRNERMFSAMMALFLGSGCLAGWRHARALAQLQRMPKHPEFSCPSCHESPPGGPLWRCASCGHGFDPFSTQAVCPHCATRQAATQCPQCGTQNPVERWSARDINI